MYWLLLNSMINLMAMEVYILIIPGFGIVSHVISTFSGKPVFGYFITNSSWKMNNLMFNYKQYTLCRKYVFLGIVLLMFVFEVKIYIYKYNLQDFNYHSVSFIFSWYEIFYSIMGTSETECIFSILYPMSSPKQNLKFCQWAAGLIDGDGNFYVSKLPLPHWSRGGGRVCRAFCSYRSKRYLLFIKT